jgi:hypothetical protein
VNPNSTLDGIADATLDGAPPAPSKDAVIMWHAPNEDPPRPRGGSNRRTPVRAPRICRSRRSSEIGSLMAWMRRAKESQPSMSNVRLCVRSKGTGVAAYWGGGVGIGVGDCADVGARTPPVGQHRGPRKRHVVSRPQSPSRRARSASVREGIAGHLVLLGT